MRVDGRAFAHALKNVLYFCPDSRPWVRFRYIDGQMQLLACDNYTIGVDFVGGIEDVEDWPQRDVFLDKGLAKEVEKASRLVGGNRKLAESYTFTAEAFDEPDEEQAFWSRRADEVMARGLVSKQDSGAIAFLPELLAKFCRLRRQDRKPAVVDIRLGDPVLVKVGTFVGLIKPIDRAVYAERQDEAALWNA